MTASRASKPRSRPSAPMPDPPELIEGDYAKLLPTVLADRPADALTVVFETFSDRLPPRRGRARAGRGARDRGRRRPAARVGLGEALGARAREARRSSSSSYASGPAQPAWPRRSTPTATGSTGGCDHVPRQRDAQARPQAASRSASIARRPGSSRQRARISSTLRARRGSSPFTCSRRARRSTPELLARVSTLPHPARAIGVYRRDDLPTGTRDVCLALWRLSDPGNVGTLLRTADAFSASVALSEECADPLSPKALRASAGSIFRVPLVGWDECPGRRLALAAHGGTPLPAADLDPPVTFLLGAERAGLPEELATDCHEVTIPLPGGAESLNVAAAGAIALYAVSVRDSAGR